MAKVGMKMPQAVYSSLSEITKLQTDIMTFVNSWAREKKSPIPQKEIVEYMIIAEVGQPTTLNALTGLLQKGYLRKATMTICPYCSSSLSNKAFYVGLRTV